MLIYNLNELIFLIFTFFFKSHQKGAAILHAQQKHVNEAVPAWRFIHQDHFMIHN